MTDSTRGDAGAMRRLLQSPEFLLYALFVVSVSCALVLLSLPRAIAPLELPALVLPAAAVQRVLQQDARRAAAAPKTPASRDFEQRYLEFGASEIAAIDNIHLATLRRRKLNHLWKRVAAESGELGALAMRAKALEQFEAALDSRLPKTQSDGLLGVFANVLIEHRATRAGRELAPHFVMRTLYKARWNLMADLAPDFRFEPIESMAYFGWLGIHADNLPIVRRREALQKYAAAGGNAAAEAQGVLAFLDHDYAQARALLSHAYAAAPTLRLRNYVRGVGVATTLDGAPATANAAP